MMQTQDFHQRVYLIPWNADWETRYRTEAERLKAAFESANYYATVRHVGSTSIRGLTAKPIIDILVTVVDGLNTMQGAAILVEQGYTLLGECGRPGRLFLSKGNSENDAFYVHLSYEHHPCARDMLDFQTIENASETVRNTYALVKTVLAALYSHDRAAYRKEKSRFIESVLEAYRIGKEMSNGNI